jgi:hypothetical protein
MKRILLLLTIVGLSLPAAPRAQAATDVSLNFFYDNLSPYGNWIDVADYGYCFQPNITVSNSGWRPYSDGYWAYTDVGWTWVSYEDFGWATYHYGRWANLANYGWVWVPGYEWGPAWVSWRTGGDYVGWAPLPPVPGSIYAGRVINGGVDFTFGIGPLYYNFVDIRYIGEPVLRNRIIAPSRNVTVINQTVNVTNITYNNSTVYNYGPDYDRLNQYSTRPIQRLNLKRETTVAANLATTNKGKNLNRVSGDDFTVVAPAIQKSEQNIAPKQVKAKVEKPSVEHGWQGIANRQQIEAAMKKETSKNVPPPTFQAQKDRTTQDGQQPAKQPPNGRGLERQQARQDQPAEQAPPAQGGQEGKQRNARREQTRDRQAEQPEGPQMQEERRASETEQAYNTQQRRSARRAQPYQDEGSRGSEAGNGAMSPSENAAAVPQTERKPKAENGSADNNRDERNQRLRMSQGRERPESPAANRQNQSGRGHAEPTPNRPGQGQRWQQNRGVQQAPKQQQAKENRQRQRKAKKEKPEAEQTPQP